MGFTPMGGGGGAPSGRLRRALPVALTLWAFAAMLPSCVLAYDEGPTVDVQLVGAAGAAPGLVLHEGWLSIEDAWLEPCAEAQRGVHAPSVRLAAARRAMLGPGLLGPGLLGPGRARALHREGFDHLQAPSVVSLLPGVDAVGAFHPAASTYCALSVVVGPSEALDGWTLSVRADQAGEARDVRGYAMGVWTLPFDAPLSLDAERPHATIDLHVDLPSALDMVVTAASSAAWSPEERGVDLYRRLRDGARVQVGR